MAGVVHIAERGVVVNVPWPGWPPPPPKRDAAPDDFESWNQQYAHWQKCMTVRVERDRAQVQVFWLGLTLAFLGMGALLFGIIVATSGGGR